ncbi:MAG: adenylate/guanylate cyclase domain-containing protein, partial [Bacteroidota bacterium]
MIRPSKGFHIWLFCLLLPLSALADDPPTYRAELDTMPENREKVTRFLEVALELSREYPRESVEFNNEALTLAQTLRSREAIVEVHSNFGLVYMNQSKFNLARESLQKAIRLKKQLVARKLSPFFYNGSIAEDYRLLGICYDSSNDPKQAINAFKQGIPFAQKSKSPEQIAKLYNSLGEVQLKIEAFQDAQNSFQQALKYAKTASNPRLTRIVERNLATNYALLESYLETQQYMMEAEAFAVEADSFASTIDVIRDSLEYVQEDRQLIIGEKKLLEIERDRTQAERDLALSQTEALEQRQQKWFIGGIGGGVVALLTIIGLVSRSNARKKHGQQMEAEREKSVLLLHNILPTVVADDLLAKKRVPPKRYENVSILFTDFKGFTEIAAQLSPEDLVAELEFIFGEFDIIIEKYGLEKIKTIGDAYMAASGLPEEKIGIDHALDAVAAAIEMQEIIRKWGILNRQKNKPVWELRIGLHSGPVVAAVIGESKFAYDVWGDTVNIASRMESNGEVGKVNISQTTYQLVERYCDCEARGNIAIKNRGEIGMYFARRMKAQRKTKETTRKRAKSWWR